jgi:predicted ATPase
LAQEGDFIIIDEPELNLHPDNQRKIARWLVRVVNAGFKVMITTHSDYIIREFNNLIMLQTAKDD